MSGYQTKTPIHPGRTLRMHLDYYGVSNKWLADRTGLTEKHISEITNEKSGISADTAIRFAKVLGGSTSFWINLDANYRMAKAEAEATKDASRETELLSSIPYQTLVKADYIEDDKDITKRVLNLQKFFGVNSLYMILESQEMALRKDDGESDPYLLAAWLRKGELCALKKKDDTNEYDRNSLIDSLPKIRKMILKDPISELETLTSILEKSGIIFVVVEPFENLHIKGATRWIGKNPVIQISGEGESIEEKWFTIFHEIGHVLFHGKKDKFMEFDKDSVVETDEEKEQSADDFAKKQMFLSCIAD